jgi:hypothetical protein
MSKSLSSEIDEANKKAVERILAADSWLVDIKPAIKAIPGYKEDLITHAGPPIEWNKMCFTQKFAIKNVAVYEGLARTQEDAEKLIERGEILIEPNHKYGLVSGMCGVTAASFPIFVIENKVHGNVAFNWQQTDVTAFGDVYERVSEIDFVKKVLAPVMKATIKEAKGINIKELLVRGLQMGDDLHGTFDACRGILVNWIFPYMLKTGFSKKTLAQVAEYFAAREGRWYCGNLMMGACKAMMDAAKNIKYSSIVTAMARNGVDFGIRVSGLGDEWFLGSAGNIKGFMFPGFKEEDSTLDIGDSAISETRGLGATALPASPSLAKLVGESFQDAINHTKKMKEVSVAEDPVFRIPYMDFMGVPVGIDIRKVVAKGILPKIDTGMAHKLGGHTIIGTGVSIAPMECFKAALKAFGEKYA